MSFVMPIVTSISNVMDGSVEVLGVMNVRW